MVKVQIDLSNNVLFVHILKEKELKEKTDYAMILNNIQLVPMKHLSPLFFLSFLYTILGGLRDNGVGLTGTFVIWDYNNHKAVCAGNINYPIICNFQSKAKIKHAINSLFIKILNKTPFWHIQQDNSYGKIPDDV